MTQETQGNPIDPQFETDSQYQSSSQPLGLEGADDIVSVNKKSTPNNRVAKAVFLLAIGALLVGGLAWFTQHYLNARKAQLRQSASPKAAEDSSKIFNPEKTGKSIVKPKLGSDSGQIAPSLVAASSPAPIADTNEAVRPLRGADGKVMVNAQGRALGVDKEGKVIEVPPIAALGADQTGRKPLPGEAARSQPGSGGQSPQKLPPSRYAGSLFVGEPAKPTGASQTGSDAQATSSTAGSIAQAQATQIADILRGAGLGTSGTSRSAQAGGGQAVPTSPPPGEPARPGTVGSSLHSSATPVAFAKRMADQNLVLPKGRQADCILTGRIIDEVPGFTSCVLAQNLYSDNGRVLLLERGSELTGEYGVTNQLGLERLFVTWNRLKTPEGIEIDLSSPGSDRLGTSGLPGHLDNRWAARIGAALLISFVKDITVAIINKQTQPTGDTTTISVQPQGQNTLNASSQLAEEVIKQTIKVRPRLTINEGERIAIYVARDLDFSPVYALKSSGATGAARVLSK